MAKEHAKDQTIKRKRMDKSSMRAKSAELLLTDRVPHWEEENFLARRIGPLTETAVTQTFLFTFLFVLYLDIF